MPKGKAIFQSRSFQVADYLRRQLRAGYWDQRMPSERALMAQTGVSRRTIRAALEELQREGFIRDRSPKGTRLVAPKARRKVEELSVGIVFPRTARQIRAAALQFIDELRKTLAVRNIRLEMHRARYLESEKISADFRRLMAEIHHDAWILGSPPAAMQRWCRSHGIPAMIFGVGDPEANLPNLSLDYHAISRHAAGELLRLGHRHLALFLPRPLRAEDHETAAGFQAAVDNSPHPDARVTLAYHDQTIANVCQNVGRMLKTGATGWFIARQGHFITVQTDLLRRGFAIPEAISLISRDADAYLDDLVPTPTRYEVDLEAYARRCAQLAMRLIEGQCEPGEAVRLVSSLVRGETTGPPPAPATILLDGTGPESDPC